MQMHDSDIKDLQAIVRRCLAKAGHVLAHIAESNTEKTQKARALYTQDKLRTAIERADKSSPASASLAYNFMERPGSSPLTPEQAIPLAKLYEQALTGTRNDTITALADERGTSVSEMQLAIVTRCLRSPNL